MILKIYRVVLKIYMVVLKWKFRGKVANSHSKLKRTMHFSFHSAYSLHEMKYIFSSFLPRWRNEFMGSGGLAVMHSTQANMVLCSRPIAIHL